MKWVISVVTIMARVVFQPALVSRLGINSEDRTRGEEDINLIIKVDRTNIRWDEGDMMNGAPRWKNAARRWNKRMS